MYRGPTSVPSFGTPMNTPGASVPTLGHGSIPTPHPAPSALTHHGDASEPSSALSFLSDNWKLILGASVVAAIAAGAVFWATSSPPPPSAKNPNFEQEKKKGKKKKVSAPQEEESSPAQPAEKKPQEEAKPADAEDPYAGLSVEEKALKIKEKGNKYFAGKKYDKAIELYTEALELVPNSKEAAVFYSNRAACYSNLNMHDLVIADCNSALSIDKMYVKALNRRAAAYEHLKRYHEALVDLTAACILEGFKNDVALKGADRIIKHLGTERASEFFPKRSIRLPANYFLTSYFDSFSNPYETILPHESADKEGDAIYLEAVKKVRSRDFSGVFELVESALEKDTSFKAQAHNLRGTLKYLMGNYDGAIEDLSQALELELSSNSLIKRASVWFEKKQIEECFGDFNRAASANPDNSDVYYHRGQAHFVTGDLAAALEDYKKAMSINPDVPFVHVQMAVIYFRAQSIQTSIETFKTALEKFPNYGDLYNYYGEVLTELQQFEEALKNFEIAFQKNPQNPLSLINKSFLLHRWKEDAAASEALLKQATEVDPYCELAYAHLGQLFIQQSKLPEAIEAYEKAVECSRTEGEIAQWYSCVEAAVAQSKVLEMYPHIKDLAKGGSA